MTKKTRKAAAAANKAWLAAHTQTKSAATRRANHERQVAAGKQLAGLRPVAMSSIADQLDEVDPKVRGMMFRESPRRTGDDHGPPLSIVGRTPVTGPFISSTRVVAKRTGNVNPKDGKATGGYRITGIRLPMDIAERIADRIDGMRFEVELNDDGILFRPAGTGAPRGPVSLPVWVPNKK